MWHQQQSSSRPRPRSNLVEDSDLDTDSSRTSGHQVGGLGLPYSHQSDEQWKQEMSSSTASIKDSDSGTASMYDSGLTDSGFLSGSNLLSSECINEEIGPSRPTPSKNLIDSLTHDHSPFPSEKEESCSFARLDSGVDVGLSDQFCNLSFKNIHSPNDLSVTPNATLGLDANSCRPTNISVDYAATRAIKTFQTSEQLHPLQDSVLQNLRHYFKQDDDGDTQLHIAIVQGFIEVVYSLIRMVHNPCYLDIVNDDCQTPLHLAVITRQARIARLLLIAGAKVTVLDRNGNTALHLACKIGDVECFKVLTEPVSGAEIHGANLPYTVHAQQIPQDLEAHNYEGQTCVHLAAIGGCDSVLRCLVSIGANVNAREAKSGRTALHFAIEQRIVPIYRFLLDECLIGPGGLQLETQTYDGYTAYQIAKYVDMTLAQEIMQRAGNIQMKQKDSDSDYDSDSTSDAE